MSEPNNSLFSKLPAKIYAQIIIGVAAQVVIFWQLGVYWAVCATPLAFATFAAVNLTDLDEATERRFKSILTWVTFGSIAAALLFQLIAARFF